MSLIIAFRKYANAINNIESNLKPKKNFAHSRFLKFILNVLLERMM